MDWQFLPLAALTALIGVIIGATLFSPTPVMTTVSDNEGTTALEYHAVQCTYLQRAGESEWTKWDCNPNLFNDDGKRFVADQLSASNATPQGVSNTTVINVIAVANKTGNGIDGLAPNCGAAQAASDDWLCGEYKSGQCGMARAAATVKLNSSDTPNAGNWTLTKEFTNSCSAAIDVNSTGLFNTTTVNQSREIFFAQNTFTTATLQQNDKINVTWFIWVQ